MTKQESGYFTTLNTIYITIRTILNIMWKLSQKKIKIGKFIPDCKTPTT